MRFEMKKIIIGICIGVVLSALCTLIYVKFFMFVPDKDGMINPNVDQKEQISVGEDVKFGGHTSSEWTKMINNFYDNNFEFIPEVKCCYDKKENLL